MPIETYELANSRTYLDGERPRLERRYRVVGTDDEDAARGAVAGEAPTESHGLFRNAIEVEPVGDDNSWFASVIYEAAEVRQIPEGEGRLRFEVGTRSERITNSLSTVASYAPVGETAPDFNGAIAVTESGVDGADIVVPTFSFEIKHATQAQPDLATIYATAGKVNSDSFYGLAAGECLFQGASGTQRGSGEWELTYRFAGAQNRTGLTVGPITGIAKDGWDLLWVRYKETEDVAAKTVVQTPVAVYIERVYDRVAFSNLGLP